MALHANRIKEFNITPNTYVFRKVKTKLWLFSRKLLNSNTSKLIVVRLESDSFFRASYYHKLFMFNQIMFISFEREQQNNLETQ